MRGVVFDPNVAAEIHEIYGGAEIADEAMRAIEWTLSRDPTQGQEVGSGFWAIEHTGVGIWRTLIFYYDFSATEVWVQGVRKVE